MDYRKHYAYLQHARTGKWPPGTDPELIRNERARFVEAAKKPRTYTRTTQAGPSDPQLTREESAKEPTNKMDNVTQQANEQTDPMRQLAHNLRAGGSAFEAGRKEERRQLTESLYGMMDDRTEEQRQRDSAMRQLAHDLTADRQAELRSQQDQLVSAMARAAADDRTSEQKYSDGMQAMLNNVNSRRR